jgi:hypothetical protein
LDDPLGVLGRPEQAEAGNKTLALVGLSHRGLIVADGETEGNLLRPRVSDIRRLSVASSDCIDFSVMSSGAIAAVRFAARVELKFPATQDLTASN